MNLKKYHLFEKHKENFLVNADNLLFAKIDAVWAAKLKQKAIGEISSEEREILRKLSLQCSCDYQGVKEPSFTFAPPETLVLMLTYDCNMACRYCCGEDMVSDNKSMSVATGKDAINWFFAKSGAQKDIGIGFFGGEPLLEWDKIEQLVEYSEKKAALGGKNIRFGFMTNGLLLSDRIIEYMMKKNFEEVTVSFDGPEDIQNFNRPLKGGGASYAKIVHNVQKLLLKNKNVGVRATIAAGDDIEAVMRGLRTIGFINCRVDKVSNSLIDERAKNDEKSALASFIIFYERRATKILKAIKDRDSEQLYELLCERNFADVLKQVIACNDPYLFADKKCYFTCGTGRGFLTVDVDGDIYPCPRFLALPDEKIGNIGQLELSNDKHRKSLPFHNENCKNCWARFYCGGACIVEHLAYTRSIWKSNPNVCAFRKAKLESAIYIAANLNIEDEKFLFKTEKVRNQ